jgi:hypothetical protein
MGLRIVVVSPHAASNRLDHLKSDRLLACHYFGDQLVAQNHG